jgi:hypothetical protein
VRAAGEFRIERYGRRFWAVYEDGKLLCVTVYKKGAVAVVRRIAGAEVAEQAVEGRLPFAAFRRKRTRAESPSAYA